MGTNVLWITGDESVDVEERSARRFRGRPAVIGMHPDLLEEIQALTPHVITIRFKPDFYARNRRSHSALIAARLAAMAHFIPPVSLPDWCADDIEGLAPKTPPPLVGARTSTAPPTPSVSDARMEVLI